MSTDLFRKKALSKYLRTDAPGALLTIAPPSTMFVFATMAAVVVVLLLLAIFGRAQMSAEGRGVVAPDAPPVVLRAPFAGTVLAVSRATYGQGKAGDLLVTLDARAETELHARCVADVATDRSDLAALEKRLADWNDAGGAHDRDASTALVLLSQVRTQREKTTVDMSRCDALGAVVDKSKVVFPVDARVGDIEVAAGAQVREGDVLAALVPTSAKLVGYLVLGEQHRSEVTAGMPVRVKFDALPSNEVGAGSATVARVLEALPHSVKIDPGAMATAAPASVFVELSLDAMPPGSGPPRSGMTFTADVLTERRQILALLFGGPGGV